MSAESPAQGALEKWCGVNGGDDAFQDTVPGHFVEHLEYGPERFVYVKKGQDVAKCRPGSDDHVFQQHDFYGIFAKYIIVAFNLLGEATHCKVIQAPGGSC